MIFISRTPFIFPVTPPVSAGGFFFFPNNKHEKSPDVSVEAWMRYCISAADIAALSSFPLRGAELVGIFRVSRIDRSSVAASA